MCLFVTGSLCRDPAARRRRHDGNAREPLSILMVDLDGFKRVNDSLGHQAGNHVLRETADVLGGLIREIDQAGRYGGDEFLLVLPGATADGARQVAARIVEAAGRITSGDDDVTPVRLSIGVATLPDDGESRQELITVSDRRMYEAKALRP